MLPLPISISFFHSAASCNLIMKATHFSEMLVNAYKTLRITGVLGCCPLLSVLKIYTTRFRNRISFCPQVGGATYSLGSSRRS
jgi:hypothetical protein